MYNEQIINNIKDFLKGELETIQKELTGDVDYMQGFLMGERTIINFVLETIDIGKEDK